MATKLNLIKTNIKAKLDKLVRTGVLADVQVDDFKGSLFDRNFSTFPCAIVTTPSIESIAETNTNNLRTYNFGIAVVSNQDDIEDATQIEDLIENILNEFDNDPELKAGGTTGVADGGVEPSSSPVEAHTDRGKNYVYFFISLRIKALRDLDFQ